MSPELLPTAPRRSRHADPGDPGDTVARQRFAHCRHRLISNVVPVVDFLSLDLESLSQPVAQGPLLAIASRHRAAIAILNRDDRR